MAVKKLSIEGNVLQVELDDLEATVLSRTWVLSKALIELTHLLVPELILGLAAFDRNQIRELQERLSRGEDPFLAFPAAGLDLQFFLRKMREIKWPTNEEIYKALAWR
jgi:hypothetical protein